VQPPGTAEATPSYAALQGEGEAGAFDAGNADTCSILRLTRMDGPHCGKAANHRRVDV
jgi:hypothetical protein